MCGRNDDPLSKRNVFDQIGRSPLDNRGETAMCGGGSSPEQDLDDPNYDAFRVSRRARGRKDGPWNRGMQNMVDALLAKLGRVLGPA